MRTKTPIAATALTVLVFGPAAMAAEQPLDTGIGKPTFTHDFVNGYPTDETIQILNDKICNRTSILSHILRAEKQEEKV